jgi:1-phosphatidylinositol-4-phosphate 5-kinase
MNFSNEDVYEGFWENDAPHGKGVYTWKYGGSYIGDFVGGKMEG